ncbi:MAG: hypothetical protein KGZ58_02430 [Ignavibacteriales bacterium]|nr:hypothetical protein [Ignavibacteriales bacterium]
MRKQYHFRPSRKGYFAWDVDRLVALTKSFPSRQVPIESIRELDENFWFDGEGDKPTCRAIAEHFRFVEEADLHFPIILSSNGRVMDGMHRVVKAFLRGNKTIEAVQFTQDPDPDYENVMPDELPY